MINHDQYSEPIASDDGWFKAQIESYRMHKEYEEAIALLQAEVRE